MTYNERPEMGPTAGPFERWWEEIAGDAETTWESGWSEESRIAIADLLDRLKQRLASKDSLTEEEKQVGISRGMDSWGIIGGDLLKEGAEISCQLRELKP